MRFLFVLSLVLPALLSFPARAEQPWALPLLTGGGCELGTPFSVPAGSPRSLALQATPGWRMQTGVTYDDTLHIDATDEQTDLSAESVEMALRWDTPQQGEGWYRFLDRSISYVSTSPEHSSRLTFAQDDHRLSLRLPLRRGWQLGARVESVRGQGGGHSTSLEGIVGDAPDPGLSLTANDTTAVLSLAWRGARGGAAVNAGQRQTDLTLFVDDTDDLRVPCVFQGAVHGLDGWIVRPEGTYGVEWRTGTQDGKDNVRYNGQVVGNTTGRQQARQCAFSFINRTRTTALAIGTASFMQDRSGYAIRPNASGWTALANGHWEVGSVFGAIERQWRAGRRFTWRSAYQLHRIHLIADGLYRAGYLGGLLETDRKAGAENRRGWLHYLSLDSSVGCGTGRLGYRGQLALPLFERDSAPSDGTATTTTRGGLTHSLYWQREF